MNFEGAQLHERIKALIGEAVEARVVVRTPTLGSTVQLGRVALDLLDIQSGEGDIAAYGESLFDPSDT